MLSLPRTARRGLAVAMLLAVTGQPMLANQTDSGTFSLSLRGIPAGELKFSGTINATSYAVNGTLRSTGILGAVRKVRYDAAVQGSHAQGRFTPSSYTEKADTSKRQSESVMAYKAGVPQVFNHLPSAVITVASVYTCVRRSFSQVRGDEMQLKKITGSTN